MAEGPRESAGLRFCGEDCVPKCRRDVFFFAQAGARVAQGDGGACLGELRLVTGPVNDLEHEMRTINLTMLCGGYVR